MSNNSTPTENPLRKLFEEIVYGCYSQTSELNDAEISSYVAGILTEFAETEQLYRIRDGRGRPLREVSDMLVASDPVYGEAYSFPREREVRKHIGDFSLFFCRHVSGIRPMAAPQSAGKSASVATRRQRKLLHCFAIQFIRV